ncbi:restriction endonuclease subunit S [Atlantibacter hermannii]|nr:restriction endonuclease subunit S [Atlantibacter hermannii]MBL7674966.1 restriction endonuclease subunit S [Atlantibacter hermannii]
MAIHIIGGDWGKDPEFSEEGYESVSCIRGSEFRNWKKNFGNTAVIRKVKASSLISRELIKNDILVEISGGGPDQPVGRTVLIDDRVLNNQVLPLVCTNFLRLVRLSSEVSASFINRYLEFFYSSGEVTKYQGGSNNLRNLKFKDYSKIGIPLPPLAEQKIIAEKLDTLLAQVDSTKARLEQIPQILKRFRQAVLAAVVDGKSVNTNTDKSTLTTLGSIAKNIKYGTSKKCSETQGSTAVLRIPNIGPGYIINSNLKYADFEQKELVALTLKAGDLLLIRSNGSVDLVGKVAVISKNDTEYLYAGYLIRVRLNKERAAPKYISYCLQSPQLRQVIENIARSTSGVNNINSKELASLEIPLPPLPEQHEIVRRVEQLFAYADTIEKQVNSALTRVNSLTQSILAKAFRGELTAQWRAENPDLISGENSAAALLEKIKAERAASGGKKTSRKKA